MIKNCLLSKHAALATFLIIINASCNQNKPIESLMYGKWISLTNKMEPVSLILNNDGKGQAFFGTTKSVYNFKYNLVGDSLIKLSSAKGFSELHYIRLEGSKKISLRPYPFEKYRESIALIDTDYEREYQK